MLLPVLCVILQLSAQTNVAIDCTIKGQVVDSVSNETVPYATLKIVLANNPGKPVKMLACDTDGKFETKLKAPGKYILTMNSVGLAPAVKQITLEENQKQLNLGKLFMSAVSQKLNEVTVTAQKPLVKVEIDKITYNLDDDPEAITSNTLDMLRKVPMITVDGDDKIQLKGSSSFKIYMNGKPSNLISNNPGDVLKSMPASSIKNIEVITDPGAKYDAEGIGGIINIITKSALQGYTGTVRANADNFGSVGGGAYLSAKVGKFGITGNYNYNYRTGPYNESYFYRENLNPEVTESKYLTQTGRSKNKYPMQYGYLEASYEIDTLNLLSLSANRFDSKSKNFSETDEIMRNINDERFYQFGRNSNSMNNYGGTEINLDYQHSTSLKDELLTVSYKFNNSPNNSENTTLIDSIYGILPYNYLEDWSKNDASTNEHTGQVDYTRPLRKGHNLEVGAKYILRVSDSETERLLDGKPVIEPNRSFSHTQHIYSGYGSYNLKIKKFGFKAGARFEGTKLDVKSDTDFGADYFDVVPSATVSYQLSMSQTFRFGYNMRIQRPGIWYLNPYENNSNPLSVSKGNPDLDSEKSHSINMNYSMFSQKINVNASINYSFVNNGIQRYTYNDPDNPNRTISTYDNIGKNQNVGFNFYGSWNPVPKFRISLNGNLNYMDIRSQSYGDNKGFNGSAFTSMQYTLPLDFRVSLHGGYYSPYIMLQGKGSSFYFTGLSLNKDFLKKKLSVSISCQDPFWKTQKMESYTEGAGFYSESINYRTARSFRLSVSYRFGDLKSAIKKVQRGISNDDMKSGGSGGSSEGGGQ